MRRSIISSVMGVDCVFYVHVPEGISFEVLKKMWLKDLDQGTFPAARRAYEKKEDEYEDVVEYDCQDSVWCYCYVKFYETRRWIAIHDGCRYVQRQADDIVQAYKKRMTKYLTKLIRRVAKFISSSTSSSTTSSTSSTSTSCTISPTTSSSVSPISATKAFVLTDNHKPPWIEINEEERVAEKLKADKNEDEKKLTVFLTTYVTRGSQIPGVIDIILAYNRVVCWRNIAELQKIPCGIDWREPDVVLKGWHPPSEGKKYAQRLLTFDDGLVTVNFADDGNWVEKVEQKIILFTCSMLRYSYECENNSQCEHFPDFVENQPFRVVDHLQACRDLMDGVLGETDGELFTNFTIQKIVVYGNNCVDVYMA